MKINDDELGTFIPDIAGYFGERGKICSAVGVEVQCSPYSPSYIKKKTAFYAEKNIHVLWIVPLIKPLEQAVFRPQRYELYLHSMYLGYVFYYEAGRKGVLKQVHFTLAMRYIEPKSFFDENVEEQHVGDFYLKYKTVKEPNNGDGVFIADSVSKILGAWENPNNGRLNLPERIIMISPQNRWWEKKIKIRCGLKIMIGSGMLEDICRIMKRMTTLQMILVTTKNGSNVLEKFIELCQLFSSKVAG